MRQQAFPSNLKNFIVQTSFDVEEIQKDYSNLLITSIAPQIIDVEILPGGEEDFQRFQRQFKLLFVPIALGLNANGALADANISVFHNYPYGELRGRDIIIGFIDTGIDYTNVLFKEANNTTRIVGIWDQTIEGNPPPGFIYGTEYLKEQIDEALSAADPYSIVPSRDEVGHGTFLAGVAAGDDKTGAATYRGGAPEAFIAMVKLRPAREDIKAYYLIKEDALAYQENDLIAGITYLQQLARRLTKPLVICIGIGANFGAHNGSNITEQYLETLSSAQAIILVVAAGNEANSDHHYSGKVENNESETLEINVAENEKGFSLFLWTAISNKLTLSIKSPIGQVIEKVPLLPGEIQTYRFNLERTILSVTYVYPDAQTGGERILLFFEDPTPGLWSITVYGENMLDGVYNMWLPRNGFIEADTRFLKPDPEITVQIPATSISPIVMGGYDYIDQSIYIASGRGPTTANVIKPDLVAPSVNVQGPQPTGGLTTYVGTSVAAAITASACALLLQWALFEGNLQTINTRVARAILIRGARRTDGIVYPNSVEGYGKLDLQNSIAKIY